MKKQIKPLTRGHQIKTHDKKVETATQTFRMTTKIPAGIAIPDKFESRIGTLNFFDGFPQSATVEKLYDTLTFKGLSRPICLGWHQ